ncbi:MAG: ABC uptake transporter, permease protein [Anaerolineales bacterium]|jgi:simple sugar transport system permease protein|nr:ABC uptake transporter, permease protein [Anaerolineales bacterium]MBM2847452.1 uptake transporter, permease protein [Anaerolineales bacterium]
MGELFTLPVLLGIAYSGVRLATPYLYAALGEMFAQRSGVLNLGVEGIMLMGAYTGFFVGMTTGNLWLGLLSAALVGLLMGLLMAFISVTLQAEQGISGIGLHLFGLGLSSLLFKKTLGSVETISGFQPVKIPLLGDLPLVGEVFFNHSVLVYGAFLLVPVAAWVLYRSTLGLKIRAVGQNPEAADSLGVSVAGIRYFTVSLGGVLAGVAGASLSIALINLFQENMTNGQGFIAVALVYFGGWSPLGVLAGALLFSFVNALQLWIQVKGINLPSDVAVMMPYVLTIAALTFAVRRARQPAALTKPFARGES